MSESEPVYQTVARAALKYMDRVTIHGIDEHREFGYVLQFLDEIAKGQQEVRIKETTNDEEG